MFHVKKWWAWQGLNLRPLRCQRWCLSKNPLNSSGNPSRKERTSSEQRPFLGQFYRTVTALAGATS